MPAPTESLVALESQLAEALLEFETLDTAWPQGRDAIERAGIGRKREAALSEIMVLRQRITTGRAETLKRIAGLKMARERRLWFSGQPCPGGRGPALHRYYSAE